VSDVETDPIASRLDVDEVFASEVGTVASEPLDAAADPDAAALLGAGGCEGTLPGDVGTCVIELEDALEGEPAAVMSNVATTPLCPASSVHLTSKGAPREPLAA
jgi:hypothetical protein